VLNIRCFIGLFIPENVKQDIVKIQNIISQLPVVCKMVEYENLHINLSFLGEVGEGHVGSIASKLENICSKYNKFEIEVGGIKFIPNEKYIRVIVLDVLDPSNKLKALSSKITQKIGGDSKPPHITLCRVKYVKEKDKFLDNIRKLKSELTHKFNVNSISLIKSELTKGGPIYTIVKECQLGGGLHE